MKKNKPVSFHKLVIAMLMAYSAIIITEHKAIAKTNNKDCLLLKSNKTRIPDSDDRNFLSTIVDFNQYYLFDNDNLANAKSISLPHIEIISANIVSAATIEANELLIPHYHEYSLWYELVLTEETTIDYIVSSDGWIDNGDPSISVYTGNSHPLTPIYQIDVDNMNSFQEIGQLELSAGTYKIAITFLYANLPTNDVKFCLIKNNGAVPDKALELDGIDDYVSINNSRWKLFPNDDFTIELWANPASLDDWKGLVGCVNNGVSVHPTLWQNGTSLSFELRKYYPPSEGISGTIPNIFEANRWVHIAWVKEGSTLYFYKNGKLIHTETTNISSYSGYHEEFLIGASSSNSGNFKGELDEIRIWATALTETEIRENMYKEIFATDFSDPEIRENIFYGSYINKDNLIAHYNFNGTLGTVLANRTYFTHPGILKNMNGNEWTQSYALIAPEHREATNISSSGFTANWTSPITGTLDAYKIDVATDEEFNNLIITRQDVSGKVSFEATGLNPGTEYFYRVNSYLNKLGDNGAWHYSSPVKVKTIEINLAPEITSGDEISIPENQTDVRTITSTDPNEGDIVTYSITGGADQTLFTIDASTGALSFITAPDFENPTDSDGDNIYLVEITVSDPEGLTDNQILSVNITDVDENMAPLITSDNIVAVEENQTYAHTITATDEDENLTFSISGGEDAMLFTIDESTGEITFNLPPNYEIPSDEDGNNAYVIEIIVSDGRKTSEIQTLTIHVTDVAENAPTLEANDLVTPNGDGKNDFWVIENNHELIGYELIILNNIGETIFKTHSYDNTWDGKYNGKKVPNGTYYFLFVKGASVIKGFITLVN